MSLESLLSPLTKTQLYKIASQLKVPGRHNYKNSPKGLTALLLLRQEKKEGTLKDVKEMIKEISAPKEKVKRMKSESSTEERFLKFLNKNPYMYQSGLNVFNSSTKKSEKINGNKLEGIYRDENDTKRDEFDPWNPTKHNKSSWHNQEEFLKQLKKVQKFVVHCVENDKRSMIEKQKHLIAMIEFQRMELDNPEYIDVISSKHNYKDAFGKYEIENRIYYYKGKVWSEGLGSVYIPKYNVVPSLEFYEFIMNFEF
jgi:hypothetical protein